MASLLHYGNSKTWFLNYWHDGKHVVKCLHTTDLAEAMKAKLAEEVAHIRPPRPGIQWAKIGLDKEPRTAATMAKRFEVLSRYAHGVLSSEPEKFGFLLQPPRRTLLFYLGKIGDPALTMRIADHVCSQKLTVAKAQALIYRVTRRARPAPPLTKVIARAVDQWAQLYPEQFLKTSIPDVLEALAIDIRDQARREQIAA
jgi:hypothetical protein